MSQMIYICQQCGSEQKKWAGQCPDCKQWNCLTEVNESPKKVAYKKVRPLKVQTLKLIQGDKVHPRIQSHIEELDRVLGGGFVAGSAVLIGGDPGIGKSTLLLQASAKASEQGTSLYLTAEESVQQIRLRAARLHVETSNLKLASCTELETLLATIEKQQAQLVIIDSIQTIASQHLTAAAGTVSQVRDCAAALIQQAKQRGHALILVGHVTKDGSLAGPRVLEHMVDAVLYFEGDHGQSHRILRAIKNRFGPAGEIGIFEMRDRGLCSIRDASRLFLAERAANNPGSVVLASMEGTRPLLVEVQALVAPTVYATPKRSSVGLDVARVTMLTAVLERRIGIPLGQSDIYVNVIGGARIIEPAADLAILLAVISAYREQALPADMVVFGEAGLTGEIRAVSNPELRAKEALSLGFKQLLLPQGNKERLQEHHVSDTNTGYQLHQVNSIADAAVACLNTGS